VLYQDRRIRQRLLAQPDVERSQTLRILRRGDTGRRDELSRTLRGSFGKWLESPRSTMANLPAGFPEAATDEPGGRSQLVSG
jgi:hypothetical protein